MTLETRTCRECTKTYRVLPQSTQTCCSYPCHMEEQKKLRPKRRDSKGKFISRFK